MATYNRYGGKNNNKNSNNLKTTRFIISSLTKIQIIHADF